MKKMQPRILITNDDGIQAPGLKILESIARELSDDVWVVAPQEQQSGKGHSLTFADPLRLNQVDHQRYCVNGTPTDCMIIALRQVLKDNPPDLVLSGINDGENVAESVTQSGTIGAAMEATIHGIKAIALSQVSMEAYPTDWTISKLYGKAVLEQVMKLDTTPNTLLNVNFPHVKEEDVKGIKFTRIGRRSQMGGMMECLDPRGKPYYWVGILHTERNAPEDTDLWGILNGYVTVSPLHMDLTNYQSLTNLDAEYQRLVSAELQKAG